MTVRKINVAKKVIKRVHQIKTTHKLRRRKWINAVHHDKLRSFGVPRAADHQHYGHVEKPKHHRKHRRHRRHRHHRTEGWT